MRRPVVLAALLALLDPRHAGAEGRLAFASPGGHAEFPFDLHNNHVCVRGRLGESDSLWIVLDTGSSGASVSESRARSLGLTIGPGGTARGSAGVVQSGRVTGATVRLPGLDLVEQDLDAVPLDSIAVRSGRPMDVILGLPLFSHAVVELDYAARMVRVFDVERVPPDSAGAVLPLALVADRPYVMATIELAGRPPIEGQFLLDTGAAPGLMLAEDLVREEHVLQYVPPTRPARTGGVGGTVESRSGTIARLRLGPFHFDQPHTLFRMGGAGSISAPGTAGAIGGEILRRFRVRFDYARERVRLEPDSTYVH